MDQLFLEPIKIRITNECYIINEYLYFKIYNFLEKEDSKLLFDFKNSNYTFQNDVIGTIFFFLSGYWEYVHSDKKDEHMRFPATESFQFKKGILEEPVVDILVEKIRVELNLTYKEQKPRIFISHDIDILKTPRGKGLIKNVVGDIVKRHDFGLACKKVSNTIIGKDPISVQNLINIHKKFKTSGIFFFMPDLQIKKTEGGYNLKKNKLYLNKLKKAINEINGVIGIHYDTRYLTEDRMKSDVKLLEDVFEIKIETGRAHYLYFDISKSFDILEKAGLKIDTTGGFSDRVGFRFGTSKPFKPFNFKEQREYNLFEIPLIVMDGTLQNKKYMGLSPEEGIVKINELVDKVEKFNGVFTILWHNTSFFSKKWKDWEPVYFKFLNIIRTKNMIDFCLSREYL